MSELAIEQIGDFEKVVRKANKIAAEISALGTLKRELDLRIGNATLSGAYSPYQSSILTGVIEELADAQHSLLASLVDRYDGIVT